MTLLFAGHDTTTSTVSFMFYELARNPEVLADPEVSVEMILDETLRKYPPAYIGPRRAIESVRVRGRDRPGRGPRRILLVGEPPPARRLAGARRRSGPQRFTEENKAKLPLGAYVPFGGGSRTCIGMRFGQAEVAIIARAILERYRLELLPGHELHIRHAPTISPREGLPMRVCAAEPAAALSAGLPVSA